MKLRFFYHLAYFRKLLELASARYRLPLLSAATPSVVMVGFSAGPGTGMKVFVTKKILDCLGLPSRAPPLHPAILEAISEYF